MIHGDVTQFDEEAQFVKRVLQVSQFKVERFARCGKVLGSYSCLLSMMLAFWEYIKQYKHNNVSFGEPVCFHQPLLTSKCFSFVGYRWNF